jgi:hypothetical protein
LGQGAYKRAGATGDWGGAVQALRTQLALAVHPAGITAIELRGYSHYVAFGSRDVLLFGDSGAKLPSLFQGHSWSRSVALATTGVFAGTEKTTSTLQVDDVDLHSGRRCRPPGRNTRAGGFRDDVPRAETAVL